jgi:hypothetical protein
VKRCDSHLQVSRFMSAIIKIYLIEVLMVEMSPTFGALATLA